VLAVLHGLRYQGHVALEYELHPEDPLAGVRESLAYLRGVEAGLAARR
jgi:hypothetical protein